MYTPLILTCVTADSDGAATCGNDGRQAFLLEPLPCSLKQGHQQVSLNGHMVRLGWHPAHTGAFALLSARPVGSRGNSRRMSFRSAQSIVSLPMCVNHTIARNSVSVVVAGSVCCCQRGPFAMKATMRAIGRRPSAGGLCRLLGYD